MYDVPSKPPRYEEGEGGNDVRSGGRTLAARELKEFNVA